MLYFPRVPGTNQTGTVDLTTASETGHQDLNFVLLRPTLGLVCRALRFTADDSSTEKYEHAFADCVAPPFPFVCVVSIPSVGITAGVFRCPRHNHPMVLQHDKRLASLRLVMSK